MRILLMTTLLLGAGQAAMASTADDAPFVPSVPGVYGASRTGESVLLIRDYLPWGGDIVPFFTAAQTVVTVINSADITSVNLSDYCMVAVTAGTSSDSNHGAALQANVNAAVGLFEAYVQGGGVMLYQTGLWGGSIMLPGGAYSVQEYDAQNSFVAPHYLATGMPFPTFDGNWASHDVLLDLPANANTIVTDLDGHVTSAEWTIGSGAVLALTQPVECYIPGGNCWGIAPHFNQFQSNAIEYARSLGACGDPLPVSAQLTPVVDVNCLGDFHTLTVTILDENNLPLVGQEVAINVVNGPNTGVGSGTLITDALGQASWSYTSTLEGTDLLVATFTDPAGGSELSNTARKVWERCDVEAIDQPATFALEANFPNPFNPSTTINFSLAETAEATLAVFNLNGERVATLVDGMLNAGPHSVTFDASQLTSGLYLYQLESQGQVQTGRMLLVK